MAVLRTYLLLGAIAIVSFASGCGDDPFCGDGKLNNPDEQCDDGNQDDTDFCLSSCKARVLSRLFVKWQFNTNPERFFTGDSCIEMGASKVQVELTGGPEVVEPIIESCSSFQAGFVDIPAADYTIKITVLDSSGLAISNTVEEPFTFSGGNSTVEVVVPSDAWTRSYVGDFFFKVSWAGADCSDAVPAVVEQNLNLVVGGVTINMSTEGGAALNGSAASMCISLDEELPQVAHDLPFGEAEFKIQGLDTMGEIVYEEIFETFVGAGVGNPVLTFDVDLIPPEL